MEEEKKFEEDRVKQDCQANKWHKMFRNRVLQRFRLFEERRISSFFVLFPHAYFVICHRLVRPTHKIDGIDADDLFHNSESECKAQSPNGVGLFWDR